MFFFFKVANVLIRVDGFINHTKLIFLCIMYFSFFVIFEQKYKN